MQKRTCGSCRACCNVLGIEELKKPCYQWCKHLDQSRGCRIYPTRPPSCAEYQCAWLSNTDLPRELRPDRCGFIIDGSKEEIEGKPVINFREFKDGAHLTPLGQEAIKSFKMDNVILIIQTRKWTRAPGQNLCIIDAFHMLTAPRRTCCGKTVVDTFDGERAPITVDEDGIQTHVCSS